MGLLKKQKFPLLLGPRNRNDMRENNRNDKRNFERRDGKKRDFKGKRDYRDRDRKQEVQQADEEFTGGMVEGRNAVIEAFRSGKTVDKLFVLASSQDGPIRTIIREAKKHDTIINYVEKERLDELSTTGKHQGVIAQVASYSYATVEDILARAEEKGEPPFILLLDGIEDPHNLGAYRKPGRCTWCHRAEAPRSRPDSNRCQNVGRCIKLHTGGKGDESGADHGNAEGKGHLVCLRGHERTENV